MADVKICVVPFKAPSATGTMDVLADGVGGMPSLGGLTPKCVMIFGGAAADSDTVETIDARQMIGWAVNGGSQSVHSASSRDNQSDTDSNSRWRNDRVLRAGDSSAGFILASVSAFIANGVTLNFTDTIVDRRYVAVFIAGADAQAAAGILQPNGSNAVVDVTAPGFTPALVLLKHCNENAANDTNAILYGSGLGVSLATGVHRCIGQVEADNVASGTQPGIAIYDTASVVIMNPFSSAAVVWTAICDDFDANGFSLHCTGPAGSESIGYLALNLGGAGVFLTDIGVETVTGNKAYTGAGFTPQFLLTGAASRVTKNASSFDAADAASIGYGVSDGVQSRAQSVRMNHNADPTDVAELCSPNALAVGTDTDPRATRATLVSFDADGFTLNYGAVSGTATRAFVLAIAESTTPPAPARVSSLVRLTLAGLGADSRVSSLVRLVLGEYAPCLTHRAQLWKITRRDGTVLPFTSHDAAIDYGPHSYSPCHSLRASASEQTAEMEGASNMELSGIISDEAIGEADIEAGLYDDAYIEVFLVSWRQPDDGIVSIDTVRRLAAGWVGQISAGKEGLRMEVLGPGARLGQKAIVDVYGAACRFDFGDPETCGVDIDALALPGVVSEVTDTGHFVADLSVSTAGAQYDQGFVRWLTGVNAGVDCEVKTATFATGDVVTIVLWSEAPFTPAAGDTFDLFPGCDRLAATCKDVYANKPNFGGFDTVPGNDAIAETPDAKH